MLASANLFVAAPIAGSSNGFAPLHLFRIPVAAPILVIHPGSPILSLCRENGRSFIHRYENSGRICRGARTVGWCSRRRRADLGEFADLGNVFFEPGEASFTEAVPEIAGDEIPLSDLSMNAEDEIAWADLPMDLEPEQIEELEAVGGPNWKSFAGKVLGVTTFEESIQYMKDKGKKKVQDLVEHSKAKARDLAEDYANKQKKKIQDYANEQVTNGQGWIKEKVGNINKRIDESPEILAESLDHMKDLAYEHKHMHGHVWVNDPEDDPNAPDDPEDTDKRIIDPEDQGG